MWCVFVCANGASYRFVEYDKIKETTDHEILRQAGFADQNEELFAVMPKSENAIALVAFINSAHW